MATFLPQRPAYALDPYPFLHRLRAEEPVHKSRELGSWVVTVYAEARRVLSDDEHFSPDPTHEGGELGGMVRAQRATLPLGEAPILGNSDPPAHDRLRAIVNRAFTPRALAAFEAEVNSLVAGLLEPWQKGEPFEVMGRFAQPLAVTTVLAYLGVPPEDLGQFRDWSGLIMAARSGQTGPEGIAPAIDARLAMEDYLRSGEFGGVIGELLAAEGAGQLTFDELVMLLIHISFAGNGPTAYAVGNSLLALASHPDQFDALRADPSLAPAAVEECLRFDSPTHVVHRFVTEPIELRGRKLRVGDTVAVVIGGANRDPDRFPDADRFDIGRDAGGHLSFGHGIHFCLGAPLARMELASVLRHVASRFSSLDLLPEGLVRGDTFLLRGPAALALAGR